MGEYVQAQSFETGGQTSSQKMDFAFTLMRHIDRINIVTTTIDSNETPAARIRTLEVAIYALRQELSFYWDETYTNEMKEVNAREFDASNWDNRQKNALDSFGVTIRLMARLNLLLKTKVEEEVPDDVDPLEEDKNETEESESQ